jgi:hypothetical protein
MECGGCRAAFGDDEQPRGSISIEVMGDEITYSCWHCSACGCYTEERIRDSFTTGEHLAVSGPISAERGQAILDEIARCPEPGDKHCDCKVHRNW